MSAQKKKSQQQPKIVKEVRLSLVGMSYRVPVSTRKQLVEHVPIRIKAVREPNNVQDPDAIAIHIDDAGVPFKHMKIGYLRRQVAGVWAPQIDKGNLEIQKGYLAELDPELAIGEMLLTVKAIPQHLRVGP
jgi:HIRAN domain